jgi:DNA polymerase type B, organellar and viral
MGRIHGVVAIVKFCAIDTETTGEVPQFHSGALWSDETQLFTESHAEFLQAMRAHARKGYKFVAHNAEYDGNVILWNAGEDFTIHYINDTYDCGYWTWGNPRQRAQLWDTVRLSAGMSLRELGEAIGLPKWSTPKALLGEDDWRPSWMCDTHSRRECIECYALRDAEIVWSYVNMLREWMDSNLCALRRSLPGNAVALWQQWDRDMQQTISDPRIKALGRAALHGGRVEPFKYGNVGMVNTYDSRSHYGAIMASEALPDTRNLTYMEGELFGSHLNDLEGIIDATVWVEPQHIPPLPAVWNEHLYFPVGTFRGQWPICELRNAQPYGVEILKVHRAAVTMQTVRPLAFTAETLLEMRATAKRLDDPRQLLYKFLLNAIPGRLGMREVQTRRMYRRWRPGLTREQVIGYDLESSANYVYLAKETQHVAASRTANIVWAACILGHGRMRLLDRLLLAGPHAVYCDTDSVHCTTALPVGSGEAGTWIDTGLWDSSLYLGPKLYRLESHVNGVEVRAKGVPRSAAREYIESGRAQFTTSLSVREAIFRGLPSGTWVEAHREMGHAPGYRTIHDPSVLKDRAGYSPTSPVVFASDYDGGMAMTPDIIGPL